MFTDVLQALSSSSDDKPGHDQARWVRDFLGEDAPCSAKIGSTTPPEGAKASSQEYIDTGVSLGTERQGVQEEPRRRVWGVSQGLFSMQDEAPGW